MASSCGLKWQGFCHFREMFFAREGVKQGLGKALPNKIPCGTDWAECEIWHHGRILLWTIDAFRLSCFILSVQQFTERILLTFLRLTSTFLLLATTPEKCKLPNIGNTFFKLSFVFLHDGKDEMPTLRRYFFSPLLRYGQAQLPNSSKVFWKKGSKKAAGFSKNLCGSWRGVIRFSLPLITTRQRRWAGLSTENYACLSRPLTSPNSYAVFSTKFSSSWYANQSINIQSILLSL